MPRSVERVGHHLGGIHEGLRLKADIVENLGEQVFDDDGEEIQEVLRTSGFSRTHY